MAPIHLLENDSDENILSCLEAAGYEGFVKRFRHFKHCETLLVKIKHQAKAIENAANEAVTKTMELGGV
jgi:hypothetical protein